MMYGSRYITDLSGKVSIGKDCTIGSNIKVNVAEELVIGDRCVIPDNAYFEGRRITIGDDFYGYSWEWNRLDVGRGRIDEEDAILTVGNRCTFHDNKIDLARNVIVGNDVGLSPEVAIYTHYYWGSPFLGQPCNYVHVEIGNSTIAGFRSVFLPGSSTGENVVVGAQAVVSGHLCGKAIYGGVPAKLISEIKPMQDKQRYLYLDALINQYRRSCEYRKVACKYIDRVYCRITFSEAEIDCENLTLEGNENEYTDDFREYLFKHGIRIYTKRPFRKLGRVT